MASKCKDHLKLIEEQKQQLQRYEKRLKDVVVAYKSLLKEKEALEASLRAVGDLRTDRQSCPDAPESESRPKKTPGSDGASNSVAEVIHPTTTDASRLKEQVTTLMKALSTLTEEKSKMEAHFQADKKQLKQERDDLANQLKMERQEWKKTKGIWKDKDNEAKNKLWTQQMERSKEQSDHAIMLRELQTLVALERSAKEATEVQLEDLQKSLDQRTPVLKKCEEYQGKIQTLSNELQVVRDRLKAAEEKASQPQPLLLRLQQEMEDMKLQHQSSVIQEQCRANSAEEQLQHIAQAGEERVASLEARLSELSEMVGNYDRIRQQDQLAIQRLKERVAQLDFENSALTRAASTKNYADEIPDNDYVNLDVHALMGKIVKLKGLLDIANQRSESPTDVQDFLKKEGLFYESEHAACKEELGQLKDEFERYKLRAQSVLKNKNVKDDGYSKGTEMLKTQVEELNKKCRALTKDRDVQEQHFQELLKESRIDLERTKLQHNQELSRQDVEHKSRIEDLEMQMKKHRERTMVLLEEKNDEIKLLKISLGLFKTEMGNPDWLSHSKLDSDSEEPTTNDEKVEPVAMSEEMSILLTSSRNESHLLYYLQEIARKDKEIADLRRTRHQLETTMRELQNACTTKEQRHAEETEHLQNEILRLDRNCSREGANLEYLKNVVYNYMMSSDPGSRQHMLNAIAALLKFSPKELESVKQYNRLWWWQHGVRKQDGSTAAKS